MVSYYHMCGRYDFSPQQLEELEKRFKAEFKYQPHSCYNCAPGRDMPVIFSDATKYINKAHWGCIHIGGRKRKASSIPEWKH